jgi:hypothetical protein
MFEERSCSTCPLLQTRCCPSSSWRPKSKSATWCVLTATGKEPSNAARLGVRESNSRTQLPRVFEALCGGSIPSARANFSCGVAFGMAHTTWSDPVSMVTSVRDYVKATGASIESNDNPMKRTLGYKVGDLMSWSIGLTDLKRASMDPVKKKLVEMMRTQEGRLKVLTEGWG